MKTKITAKLMLTVLLMLLGTATLAGVAMAGGIADQRSALNGTVLADQLAVVGQAVREGDVLVKVQTISGSSVAARASSDGTVRQVLVRPGERVSAGQVVVQLETR